MRFVVVGAGAVGGTVAASLQLAGHDVIAVARGAHLDAIRERGLHFRSPLVDAVVPLRAVGTVTEAGVGRDDVVLLATKSQQATPVLDELVACAPATTPIACLQNGVDNERRALRRFENVHGVCVMTPTAHLEPGEVACYSSPAYGILDVGRYPSGTDAVDDALATAFRDANFGSVAQPEIMRSKYSKLLDNLGNAVEALFVRGPDADELMGRARAEGEAVLRTAGIDWGVDDPAISHRRDGVYRLTSIAGERRDGGSTWQSLARGTGNIEVNDLNGEIVLLGRLCGVPTPVNEALQRAAVAAARDRTPVGSLSASGILERPSELGLQP